MSCTAANQSVIEDTSEGGERKSQLFVDILERLDVVLDGQSRILKSSVHGRINMRNFLAGSPHIRMALNENLVVARMEEPAGAPHQKKREIAVVVLLLVVVVHPSVLPAQGASPGATWWCSTTATFTTACP